MVGRQVGEAGDVRAASVSGTGGRGTLRTIIVLVLTTVLILVGVWFVQGPWRSGSSGSGGSGAVTAIDVTLPPGQAAPAVGGSAPDFSAVALDGTPISLSGLRGQPVWLVFGATWCANCRAEAPDVESVAAEYRGKVAVVSIYIGEPATTVQGYASRLGLTTPQVADGASQIGAAYAISGVPAHFFIDASGTVRQIRVGTLTQQSARSLLDQLL